MWWDRIIRVREQCESEKADRIARKFYIDHSQHYNVSIKLGEKVARRGITFGKFSLRISVSDLFSWFSWDTPIASDIRSVQGSKLAYTGDRALTYGVFMFVNQSVLGIQQRQRGFSKLETNISGGQSNHIPCLNTAFRINVLLQPVFFVSIKKIIIC